MIKRSTPEDLLAELNSLGEAERAKVLAYARSLSKKPVKGTSGLAVLAHSGTIGEKDASEIAAAIEEGCEKVNLDAW